MMVSSNNVVAKTFVSKELFWQEHIVSLRNSCLSRAEYCRRTNVNYHKFKYWEDKLAIAHKNHVLLPVKLIEHDDISPDDIDHSDVNNVTALCTLKLKCGHKLKIFDPKVLPLILNVLV